MHSRKKPLIGAVMKLEASYVLEWVAWHKLQGFDLVVADNCTEGRQTALLTALAGQGVIDYIDLRGVSKSLQQVAYRRIFWRALTRGYRWLGFLDADEFFEPLVAGETGGELVARLLQRRGVRALSFRWALYGSGGQEKGGLEPVMARFGFRAKPELPENQFVKSFARVSSILYRALSLRSVDKVISSPHVFRIKNRYTQLDDEMGCGQDLSVLRDAWRLARVRHYAVKSAEEFRVKYQLRGDPWNVEPRNHEYWPRFNRNDVHDPLPADKLAMLEAEIARLRTLCAL